MQCDPLYIDYYIVLYSIVLYYIVLYYIILYVILLYVGINTYIFSVFRATAVGSEWGGLKRIQSPVLNQARVSMAEQHGCLEHLCGIHLAST